MKKSILFASFLVSTMASYSAVAEEAPAAEVEGTLKVTVPAQTVTVELKDADAATKTPATVAEELAAPAVVETEAAPAENA